VSTVPIFGTMTSFDRFLFAFTIASHITLVSLSISLIITIVLAEFLSIRNHDSVYGALARRLTKVFTISFGVGTASGIVMAFELVTLFPAFVTVGAQTGVMELFYFEIFAFFLETLFLVLYVYYADAFKGRWTHFAAGCLVAAGTLLSAILIVAVNAWMNTPNGVNAVVLQGCLPWGNLTVTGVKPWAPFYSASAFGEIAHVLSTTLFTGCMVIGGYFAYRLVRYKRPDEKALLSKGMRLTWATSIVTLVLSGITGSNEITTLLKDQPLKYAALEGNQVGGSNLAEHMLGLSIGGLQSFLARLETGNATLPGLNGFQPSTWPPLYVNDTFDLMVLGGTIIGGYFLLYILGWILKKKPFESKTLMLLQIPAAVGAYLVYQLGWITDEVGRQPFIIYNIMYTCQAASQNTSLVLPGFLVIAFYVITVPATFYFFIRVFNSAKPEEDPLPEGQPGVVKDVNY